METFRSKKVDANAFNPVSSKNPLRRQELETKQEIMTRFSNKIEENK